MLRPTQEQRAELLAIAEPLEPRHIHLVDALLGQPDKWLRVHVERDAEGRVIGAIVLSRLCRDRWNAYPLVIDGTGVPALARALDRSKAWMVIGTTADVSPLVPLLTRVESDRALELRWYPVDFVETMIPDRRTRFAAQDDLDGTVALYEHYELDFIPTMRRLREDLARDIERERVVVMEVDGQIVAASRIECATHRFHHWSGMTVDPAHRGHRYGYELGMRGMRRTYELGLWASGTRNENNPRTPENPDGSEDNIIKDDSTDELHWVGLRFRHPILKRPRGLLERIEGRRKRRAQQRPDPTRWAQTWEQRKGMSEREVLEASRAATRDGTREDLVTRADPEDESSS